METLGAIAASPAGSTQSDVARRLRIEGPSLTRMVQLLEKEQLISRQADPGDARSKLLELTPAGEAALDEIFGLSDGMRLALLDGIDPAMLATVEAFFDEIIRRLDHPEGL
nr:MarR family transcriptional regulator [Alteraurantiacibacter buctensis]